MIYITISWVQYEFLHKLNSLTEADISEAILNVHIYKFLNSYSWITIMYCLFQVVLLTFVVQVYSIDLLYYKHATQSHNSIRRWKKRSTVQEFTQTHKSRNSFHVGRGPSALRFQHSELQICSGYDICCNLQYRTVLLRKSAFCIWVENVGEKPITDL